ncbi:MAG: lipopolysaccharide assembly protein LapA domain-containing protein [Bacillota bacterium]|nr:lipopolysaccharide assembly protein LapA domain-containing protein [Bacillota bacterium]
MSSFYLILALVFSLLIAIIALANQEAVSINYIFGRSEVPLIILILGAGFIGAMVMGLFSLFRGIRSALSFRQLRQQKEELQKKISDLEEEKLFLTAQVNSLSSVQEEIAGDEKAAVNSDLPSAGNPKEDLPGEEEEDNTIGIELTEPDEADEKPS